MFYSMFSTDMVQYIANIKLPSNFYDSRMKREIDNDVEQKIVQLLQKVYILDQQFLTMYTFIFAWCYID